MLAFKFSETTFFPGDKSVLVLSKYREQLLENRSSQYSKKKVVVKLRLWGFWELAYYNLRPRSNAMLKSKRSPTIIGGEDRSRGWGNLQYNTLPASFSLMTSILSTPSLTLSPDGELQKILIITSIHLRIKTSDQVPKVEVVMISTANSSLHTKNEKWKF